jgi:transcription antitermination protein NusB
MSKNLTNLPPGFELPDLGPEDEVNSIVVPHREATNERSMARRLALQALYELDSTNHPIGRVIDGQLTNQKSPVSTQTANYLRRLVIGVLEHRDELDRVIQPHAPEWPLNQVAIVDRNILRIAVFEFALLARTPVGVAIDEAVELAKLYGADGSPRFVNGVLGALADDQDQLAEIARRHASTVEIEDEGEESDEGSDLA